MRVALLSLWLVLAGLALSAPRVAADASEAGSGSGSGAIGSSGGNGAGIVDLGGDAVYAGDSSSSSSSEFDPTPEPNPATYLVPKELVESLVFVGSAGSPHTCVALLVAPLYVLAPAHCLTQIEPSSVNEWVVSLGFEAVPSNDTSQTQDGGDSDTQDESVGELVGRFAPAAVVERIAVASVAYQPGFLQENSNPSSNTAIVPVSDWAVVELARSIPKELTSPTKLSRVSYEVVFASATSLIGVLRVDRTSLDITFVNDNFAFANDRCGIATDTAAIDNNATETTTAESEFLCSAPRRPEERVVIGSSKHWSLLVFTTFINSVLPIGFATDSSSHVDAVNSSSSSIYQAFTFTTETTKQFIDAATNSSVIYSPTRIILGNPETLTPDLMFMAGVRAIRRGQNECGASLVSSSFVLTAAHCVEDTTASRWVSVGTAFSDGVDYGEQIKVQRVVLHPEYDHSAMKNDLALLELKYPSIQTPVTLYERRQFPVLPRSGQILGFGATSNADAELSDVLLSAQMDVIASNHECMQLTPDIIDASMFCATGQNGADACGGDSGGPLLVQETDGGKKYLLGVVSYGRGCGSGAPGVYANVSYGAAFIKSVINAGSTLPEATVMPVPTSVPSPSSPSTSVPSPSSPSTSPASAAGDTNSVTTLSPSSSSSQRSSGTATAPAAATTKPLAAAQFTFQVPANLSANVQSALVEFLTGGLSNIDSSYVKALLEDKTIVFESSASLESLEEILREHSDSALSQRSSRFETSGKQVGSC
ncbi:Trypsin protease gip [Globisporangium polare]